MIADYYEILEISPNANSETIERVFRYLAKRYHPDNRETGNPDRFNEIIEAHTALKDPVKRAQYDVQYSNYSQFGEKLAEEANDSRGIVRDVDMQDKMLSMLYVKRRQNIANPGMSNFELERLLGCPPEHLDFHIWYMKEKGWIVRLENGMLGITVDGVDRATAEHHREVAKLITDRREG
jgi:curved DNA-binding protein CbpA